MARGNRAAVLEALPLAAAKIQLQRRAMALAAHEEAASRWVLYQHQLPPEGDDWDVWILFGGRGAGKTAGASAYIDEHMQGPACIPGIPGGHRAAIIAPTLGDALEACVNGPSGLKARNPRVISAQSGGGTHVRWPNGAEGRIFGAYTPDDVERLRAGGNRCISWCEELAAWRMLDECWQHMDFGLRLGPHPRAVVSTTPKARKFLKELLARPSTAVTRGTTDDNPHLNPRVRARYYALYGGKQIGRQELGGEMIEEAEGALWTRDVLERQRVHGHPELVRVVVAVDPAVTSGPSSDETGIIVIGKGADGHGYVLADYSGRLPAATWGARVLNAYDEYEADLIVGEVNNGGDLVETNLRAVAGPGRPFRFKAVHASRGKRVRADPIASLYVGSPVLPPSMHHVGAGFELLEDQQCTWEAGSGDDSPDRLDALVWGATELMLAGGQEFAAATGGQRPIVTQYAGRVQR